MGEIQRKAKQYNQEVFLLNQSHHLWYTENRMLNIILNEKFCHKNLQNVKLELDIQEHCLDRINEMDITTILPIYWIMPLRQSEAKDKNHDF